MSRNIKEIGKELMGKSLNSFHRKTGLTQLEKNNVMQDGILNGILSQVDDAYIEKTEQSNVMHLEGSGDGVVVLDGIEGNTMVNLFPKFGTRNDIYTNNQLTNITSDGYATFVSNNIIRGITIKKGSLPLKPNTVYTLIIDVKSITNGCVMKYNLGGVNSICQNLGYMDINKAGIFKKSFTTVTNFDSCNSDLYSACVGFDGECTFRFILLEGDWTDKEVPSYFEGLQSSFEEKVNDEGKYEIEILSMNNGNIYNGKYIKDKYIDLYGVESNGLDWCATDYLEVVPNTLYTQNYPHNGSSVTYCAFYDKDKKFIGVSENNVSSYITPSNCRYIRTCWRYASSGLEGFIVQMGSVANTLEHNKQNKIKLLINEPLRSLPNGAKDKLCIKNNKLVVERNCKEILITGDDEYSNASTWYHETENYVGIRFGTLLNHEKHKEFNSAYNCLSDRFKGINIPYGNVMEQYGEGVNRYNNSVGTIIILSKSKASNLNGIKDWFRNNHTKLVIQLAEPTYEEVLNEYGEPVILEGYENGTIYIDSTIVPTTTVRYTPKMESFKTLKEVNNNNIMLTNDVNDNIIPYMMDVDLMIMEKEMALMSQYKIRRIGVKDMTSMQKRTQDMLTRLIKGKTLTEQECKTRVVTYLDAGKITDAQADELMLLISEVYA